MPPAPVLLWQTEVHKPGLYDLELDASTATAAECAAAIKRRLAAAGEAPGVFRRLAEIA
jgi:chloramphenicol 3-O phosphotransferase